MIRNRIIIGKFTSIMCWLLPGTTLPQISAKRFVKVRTFNGRHLVDIREYYEDRETGERKPGKKGESVADGSAKE